MALRGISTASTSTAVTSLVLPYTGSAIQAGDLLVAQISESAGGSLTISDPSGWTAGASLSPAIPDANGGETHWAVKIATSADAGNPSYTWSSPYAGYWTGQLRVYSGRVNTSVAAAFGNTASTTSGAYGNTPYSYTVTTPAILSGDDVVVIGDAFMNAGGPATSLTATITGYANDATDTGTASGSNSVLSYGLDAINSSATSAGTVALTLSSAPTLTISPTAAIFSLPAASAAAPKPVLSGGKVLVSGGHVVTGAMFMPLAWAINRRNKLAAEKRAEARVAGNWKRDSRSGIIVPSTSRENGDE